MFCEMLILLYTVYSNVLLNVSITVQWYKVMFFELYVVRYIEVQ